MRAAAPPIDDSVPDEQGTGDSSIDESIPLIDPTTQTTLPAGCVAPRAAIEVGVLAIPAGAAQQVADDLVSSGGKIIFIYSDALLSVPSGVTATSLG